LGPKRSKSTLFYALQAVTSRPLTIQARLWRSTRACCGERLIQWIYMASLISAPPDRDAGLEGGYDRSVRRRAARDQGSLALVEYIGRRRPALRLEHGGPGGVSDLSRGGRNCRVRFLHVSYGLASSSTWAL